MRFLAVLELYKQGLVDLDQADNFGDLTIVLARRRRTRGRRSPTLATSSEYAGLMATRRPTSRRAPSRRS